MKIFAGINLEKFNYYDASGITLSWERRSLLRNYLHHVRMLFEEGNSPRAMTLNQILNCPANSTNTIRCLTNRIKINTAVPLSDAEEIAVALSCMPDDSIKEWRGKSYELSRIVSDKNLVKAYEVLDDIVNLSSRVQDDADLPYALGLQMNYYIDLMEYLIYKLGRNDLVDLYLRVETELYRTLCKLRSLPEMPEETAISCNVFQGLFFSSLPEQVQQKISLLLKRGRL